LKNFAALAANGWKNRSAKIDHFTEATNQKVTIHIILTIFVGK